MRLYTVYYISVNCSTCFGWLLHPLSEAHITVITASGTGQTVSATFLTVVCAPEDRRGYHPKHVEQFT